MPNVKGSTLVARFQYVEERHGEEGLKALLAALPREDRELHKAVLLPSSWYPFDTFVRVNAAIDRVFGKGDLSLVPEIARYAAEKNLTTLYRFFYRIGSVGFVLSMGARLWRLNYDAGELAVEIGEGEARAKILDWPQPERAHCLSVIGWSGKSAELSGGK